LAETADRMAQEGSVLIRWSCGNTERIEAGDRVFLLRQGLDPRGIMASGVVVEPPYQAEHWDESKLDSALYVDVKLDALLNPEAGAILPRELLDEPPLSEMYWDSQRSGTTIPQRVAEVLEKEWTELLDEQSSSLVTEPTVTLPSRRKLYEGGRHSVTLDVYERNPVARRECIAHYGSSCFVCGFDFGVTYGPAGEGYIHVHHLKPISEVSERHEVDPIRDMRPVCPNCHAIIHRRLPPYGVDEVKDMLT
jgi:5-methylcytosine-specific restriction protein A